MEIPYIVTPRKDTGLFNSKIAIWLFLASEVMLFGGLFSAYVFLRIGADYPWPERTLPVLPGLLNTFILIASSVTVVFAWAALKMRKWRQFQVFMSITVACAAIFMVFKGLEYYVKFHHQALRLDDYSVVEGHLGYEKEADANAADHDHGHDHSTAYLLDRDGNKIEENHYRILASTLTFDLSRFYRPWVRDFIAEAERAGVAITLADPIDLSTEEELVALKFEAGTPLTMDFLDRLQQAQMANKTWNSKWRTRFLRQAWDEKWTEVKDNDMLGEGAFAAAYPKGLELDANQRKAAYARWKAGERARMATDVNLSEVKLEFNDESVDYAALKRPEQTAATFNLSAPLLLRFEGHDVITKYDPNGTQLSLRDNTGVTGQYLESDMVFHNVDAIDFQFVAMKAMEKGQDPEVAIQNTWLIKENPEMAELWEKHQKAISQLERSLAEDEREPTLKDRYRMGWQEIAYYMQTPLQEVAIKEKGTAAPKVGMSLIEQFKGPNYDARKGEFPHLSVPRERVMLESKFKPKWNTYYAIYFTITGLHGLHVIGGALVLGYYLFFGKQMYLTNPEWLANRVEVGGLFWHFVDLVWIFAFPIFYLM